MEFLLLLLLMLLLLTCVSGALQTFCNKLAIVAPLSTRPWGSRLFALSNFARFLLPLLLLMLLLLACVSGALKTLRKKWR